VAALVVSTYRPEFAARLAAQPSSADVTLPNFILPLPLGAGVTPLSRTLRRAFCLFTLAAIIALCASAWNNRQLLQRVGFDIQHYAQIAMDDYAPSPRRADPARGCAAAGSVGAPR
jgi:hypothetical protein